MLIGLVKNSAKSDVTLLQKPGVLSNSSSMLTKTVRLGHMQNLCSCEHAKGCGTCPADMAKGAKNSVLDCPKRYSWRSFRAQLHFSDVKRRSNLIINAIACVPRDIAISLGVQNAAPCPCIWYHRIKRIHWHGIKNGMKMAGRLRYTDILATVPYGPASAKLQSVQQKELKEPILMDHFEGENICNKNQVDE
ncbi:hypothetical protein Q9233_015017 [Columba guinea]|nr:hypothetical protein Q9233_015017 [Columba guinea]